MKDEIVYWQKEKFKDRSFTITAGKETTTIPIPNDEVICDLCNALIIEFPVAIYRNYAYCPKCIEAIKKENRFDYIDDLM